MTGSDDNPRSRWEKIPVLIRAILTGFLVFAIAGSIVWTATLILVPAPWSMALMAIVLWLYLRYCSGSWLPQATSAFRSDCFRETRLAPRVWFWSLTAAALAALFLQAALMVAFRITEFHPEVWALGIDFSEVARWQVWLFIVMAAAVAGVSEEVGFRGYMQVPLEERYGPRIAIGIVSVVFVLAHLNQAWAGGVLIILFAISALWGVLARVSGSIIPGIISHSLTDVFNFSYWWTDVAGSFDRRPLAETGVDAHFLTWLAVLLLSLALFAFAALRTNAARLTVAST